MKYALMRMNVWKFMMFIIWGPIGMVLAIMFGLPALSEYTVTLVDHIIAGGVLAIAGLLVADIFTSIGGKAITKIVG